MGTAGVDLDVEHRELAILRIQTPLHAKVCDRPLPKDRRWLRRAVNLSVRVPQRGESLSVCRMPRKPTLNFALRFPRIAKDHGFTPGFLASGYGGAATGEILVDAAADKAAMVGDEPLLLAALAPTVIGRDRAAAAKRLIATGIDLIIMDDGFQNPSLKKDISLAVVDSEVGIGNGAVFPAGPLRG